jgi:predicted metal-binding membrane protein
MMLPAPPTSTPSAGCAEGQIFCGADLQAAAQAATTAQLVQRRTDMGLGPMASFAATWVVMMAAMMLASAIPVVLEFARTAEKRPRHQVDRVVQRQRHPLARPVTEIDGNTVTQP